MELVQTDTKTGSNTHNMQMSHEETGFYEPYAEFARSLRIWFLSYGIGGPVLLLTNEPARDALAASGRARFIVLCFLTGVFVQIAVAMSYKTAMWYLYRGESEAKARNGFWYKFSDKLSDNYWIEFSLDIATLFLFSLGTWHAVSILLR
jgi:hypothetical protein